MGLMWTITYVFISSIIIQTQKKLNIKENSFWVDGFPYLGVFEHGVLISVNSGYCIVISA